MDRQDLLRRLLALGAPLKMCIALCPQTSLRMNPASEAPVAAGSWFGVSTGYIGR